MATVSIAFNILCSKSLFPFEWQTICEKMNTREVTRGSVWKQPDNEFFDKAPHKVEKFLIKWMHADSCLSRKRRMT